jgi:putative flippase GtrA
VRTSLSRSALTSIFTTALDFGVLTGLVELFGVDYVLATFLGTVVGATSNFLINRVWAFRATAGAAHWQIMRLLPVQAGSSGLQTLGVWLLADFGGMLYWIAKLVVAVAVYLGWNYPLNRYFVFGTKITGASPAARAVADRPGV